MAGDWIKIEHALPGKPEVMELARILTIDEMAVVGHLVCFWSWVDQNLSPDCPATNGTKKGLDRVAGRDGFVDAMVQVGWLAFDGQKVQVPNYDHHLSQSAKKRGLESRKKTRQRTSSRKCPAPDGTSSGQNEGPEKRREEKINESDVVIPQKLNTAQAISSAETWFDYLLSKGFDDKVPPRGSPQEEAFWQSSARTFQTPEAFCDAVQYTMANGWRTLTKMKDSKAKSNGHAESQDWILTQQACRQFPNDFQKRLDIIGHECRDALKAAGGVGQLISLTHELDIKAMGERFEFALASIRKATNGTAKSN